MRVGLEQGNSREDHPGRAVAALEGARVQERALDRMERIRGGEPLDREQLVAVRLGERRSATPDRPTVEEDGAGAADPFAAARLRTADVELVAQDTDEHSIRLDRDA